MCGRASGPPSLREHPAAWLQSHHDSVRHRPWFATVAGSCLRGPGPHSADRLSGRWPLRVASLGGHWPLCSAAFGA
eukprot:2752613-Alexandrium_andersonii.AAC.1